MGFQDISILFRRARKEKRYDDALPRPPLPNAPSPQNAIYYHRLVEKCSRIYYISRFLAADDII